MIKRVMVFMLAVLLAFSATACSTPAATDDAINTIKPESQTDSKDKAVALSSISLAYDPTDSFNPFKADSLVNSTLMPLIYDSLIKLDESYAVQKLMAKNIWINGTTCVVELKDGLKFSDNSSVSAGDVVYSANQAKSSKLYSKRLQNVSSVSQDGNKKIVFSLKREDQKFANCLDFPVVKNNTAQYKGGHPTGSGRYKLSGTSGSPSLVYNILWNPNKKPKFSKIPLVTTPAEEAIITSVKTGSVAMMFSDLSDGEIGGIGATTEPVNLNNLVYLGINANKGVLKDAEFRQAISYAIDQNTVLSKGFVGRGVATYLPYNPLMNIGEELSDKYFIGYSETKANKLLDELGYEKRNAGGIRLDKNKPIELNLLINKQNNYKKMTATGLQAMLKEVGIGVNIISEDKFSSFTSKVNQKKFDLYLGETKLLNNMDITEFFTSSALSVGITKKSTLLEAYKKYQNKSEKYSYFAKEFSEQAPFVPLLFRSGIVAYNNNIKTDIISTPSDIFYNITDWK